MLLRALRVCTICVSIVLRGAVVAKTKYDKQENEKDKDRRIMTIDTIIITIDADNALILSIISFILN